MANANVRNARKMAITALAGPYRNGIYFAIYDSEVTAAKRKGTRIQSSHGHGSAETPSVETQ